jgi:hypothetical protein
LLAQKRDLWYILNYNDEGRVSPLKKDGLSACRRSAAQRKTDINKEGDLSRPLFKPCYGSERKELRFSLDISENLEVNYQAFLIANALYAQPGLPQGIQLAAVLKELLRLDLQSRPAHEIQQA